MSDPHREPDTPSPEDDNRRKTTRRVLTAAVLVALAVAGVALVDFLSEPERGPVGARTQAPSTGRIVEKTASAPAIELADDSAAATTASEPAAEAASETAAAPGLPPSPATEITPGVAATRPTPPLPPARSTASPAERGAPESAQPAAVAPRAAPPTTPATASPAPAETARAFRPDSARAAPAQEAPVVAPRTVAPARDAGTSVGYHVQLGLFGNLDNAQRLIAALKARGIEAKTETRVFLGPFRTRAEAEEAMAAVKDVGAQPMLVPAGR
ncbi:DedD protein [Crenobacter luteus]|uniref:SPOR domain-containing protein n=1 Tax=Crenobacter luteus TaxID=1452487 RepID=UPI001053CA9B|nr:SPOR domain-containing protein [Crenobacter luteus]TCP10824.1 DedD protein [Crenobacter luteus]